MSEWRPSASMDVLRERAQVLKKIRNFFDAEAVLEVETPILSFCGASDPYIALLRSTLLGQGAYLQSSPEFAMKRLLAAGSGSIYQVCKVFRDDELGARHSPEFTMLEWYMLDWDLQKLMVQTERLLLLILGQNEIEQVSYRQLFERYFSLNPHQCRVEDLRKCVAENFEVSNLANYSKDDCLQLLFGGKIENSLGQKKITFVYDFPASQAALAQIKINGQGDSVAVRFEIFIEGLELANAYQEETSEPLLRKRFLLDQQLRLQQGKPQVKSDEKLLMAMREGLPECAGIALGFDRLMMVLLQRKHIREVLSFFEP